MPSGATCLRLGGPLEWPWPYSRLALQSTEMRQMPLLRGPLHVLRWNTGRASSSTSWDWVSASSCACDRCRLPSRCHLLAVDGNRLAGSKRVRRPTTGDSVSLLCLVLLMKWTYLFIMVFNNMLANAKNASELSPDTLLRGTIKMFCYITFLLHLSCIPLLYHLPVYPGV